MPEGESVREEIERLNPQFSWKKRKVKRKVKKRFKALVPNITLAWGCRGHPAIVVRKNFHPQDVYGADVDLKSIIDDVTESCSIFHCNPQRITNPDEIKKAYAFAADAKIIGFKKAQIRHYIDNTCYWEQHFNKAKLNGNIADDPYAEGHARFDEYIANCKTAQEYLSMDDDLWAFYQAEKAAQGKAG